MTATPLRLRAAADDLRAVAGRLSSDVEPLAEKGGAQTWVGPAATSYRRSAASIEDRANTVVLRLRRLGRRLDERADEVERIEAELLRERYRRIESQDRLDGAARDRYEREQRRRERDVEWGRRLGHDPRPIELSSSSLGGADDFLLPALGGEGAQPRPGGGGLLEVLREAS